MHTSVIKMIRIYFLQKSPFICEPENDELELIEPDRE
jgi:hypothetical protein